MTTVTPSGTRAFHAADLAHVAVFAALIAAMSLMPAIPLGGFGVPITLQTLAISITGLCLGPWRGLAAVALYLLVGSAGLPVFAGGKAGLAVWAGPTAGYLVAFLVTVVVVGFLARAVTARGTSARTPIWLFLVLIACRVTITYPLGTLGIARATGSSFGDVWLADLVYWPGDVIKSVIAVLVAYAIYKAFPRLLHR
ncbi:MAG: biotin transporter BioY [Propionibacterium sp.]|nr:biotin transporter BioY [Propionibacterium sp.]